MVSVAFCSRPSTTYPSTAATSMNLLHLWTVPIHLLLYTICSISIQVTWHALLIVRLCKLSVVHPWAHLSLVGHWRCRLVLYSKINRRRWCVVSREAIRHVCIVVPWPRCSVTLKLCLWIHPLLVWHCTVSLLLSLETVHAVTLISIRV